MIQKHANKWYRFETGSDMDTDMDVIEMAVNYYNIGHILDIDAYTSYLKYKVNSYYILFLSLFDLESKEELETLYPKLNPRMWIALDEFRKTKDRGHDFFRQSMDKIDQLLYKIKNEENTYENRRRLVNYYLNLTESIAFWFCGTRRNRIEVADDSEYAYCVLFNESGLFAFNTYLYAIYNDIHVMGIPTNYTDYDLTIQGCPGEFIDHDELHVFGIHLMMRNKIAKKNFRKNYETIMNDSDIDNIDRGNLITGLWLKIHENISIRFPRGKKYYIRQEGNISTFYADFGIKLSEEKRRKYTDMIISNDYITYIDLPLERSFFIYLKTVGINYEPRLKSEDEDEELSHYYMMEAKNSSENQVEDVNYKLLDYYLVLVYTGVYLSNIK